MTIIEKQARILNDLVLINNDRVVGYEKAMEELKKEDSDLKLLFQEKINQSNSYKTELSQEITKIGHKIEKGTTNAGKIYRVWMDVKTFFAVLSVSLLQNTAFCIIFHKKTAYLHIFKGGSDRAGNAVHIIEYLHSFLTPDLSVYRKRCLNRKLPELSVIIILSFNLLHGWLCSKPGDISCIITLAAYFI